MAIKELLSEIRKGIKSLSKDDQGNTITFLKEILKKIHTSGFLALTADEFELANTVLEATKDEEKGLFVEALKSVVSELGRRVIGEPQKKPSADWAAFSDEIELEDLYIRLRTAEIFKKVVDPDFSFDHHLTSREFDFAQKHCDSRSNRTLKQLLTQAYDTAKADGTEEDFPSKESFLLDWNTNLFDAAYQRLQFDRIIDEEQLTAKDSTPTFRSDDLKQFFDLLFHQYSPPNNSSYVAKTPLRDHRALFIALVSAAKSTASKEEHDAFFQAGRTALARLYKLESKKEDLLDAPAEANFPYASVYYVIFSDENINTRMSQSIIETLKKYDATDKGYDDARAEFLQTYHPQQLSSSASSSSPTGENQESRDATNTERSLTPDNNEGPKTEAGKEPIDTRSPDKTPTNQKDERGNSRKKHSASDFDSDSDYEPEGTPRYPSAESQKQRGFQAEQAQPLTPGNENDLPTDSAAVTPRNSGGTANKPPTDDARTHDAAAPPPKTTPSAAPAKVAAHSKEKSTAAAITVSATSSTEKITDEMVLKSLWGNIKNSDPDITSACGKTLAKWNEKQTSPAIIPPPEFLFVKPYLQKIDVKNDGKNIKIELTAKHQAKTDIKLTLSRHVDEKQNQETWTCQSSDNLISEKMQFELIAAELFALRKAQRIENAEIIGIMPLVEDANKKSQSTRFNCKNGVAVMLSTREEALIEAHIKAGFTVTYGTNEIKKIENSNTPEPTIALT